MTTRRWLPATGVGLLLATAVLIAALAVGDAASSERARRLDQAAGIEHDRVVSELERDLVQVEQLAATSRSVNEFRAVAGPRITAMPELETVALAVRSGDRLVVRTVVPNDDGLIALGRDLAADDALSIVISRVLQEADPAAGTPFTIDGHRKILVAAPVLGAPGAPELERRSSVRGAVVGVVDAEKLLGGGWPGAERLIAPDGRAVGDRATGSVFAGPADIRGRPWTLLLDAPTSHWPRRALLVLLVGLLLSLVLALVFHQEVLRRRRAEEQAINRSRQLERIAEAGARLQQTLDLAELLPTFAVALAADFELLGVSIKLLDDAGSLSEAFATGEQSETGSIELPLRRGWRAVGSLRVRPSRAMDESELTTLQALADQLAVAMSNAQLYEREQLNAARLRDLDALKNAFLGTVSHELRTSMTAIMGFGELLSDAWDNLDDDRRREMANRIRRSAGSLRHLVDDLLDFARLEQERLRVSPRAVDLSGIVRQTVEGLSPLLGRHELDLQLPESCAAWADPVAVERILANLVSNAAKYAPPDTVVTVSVAEVDGVARLVVSDQGPGIPVEERRRIFVRFYRLDTPESVRTRGAGIGLAILHDFAERSGATVEVDDAPGGGARFTVDFPTEPIVDPLEDPVAAAR